jgi:hypothetical protein
MRKRLLKSCRLLKSSYVVFTSQVGSKEEQAERMISDAKVSHEFRMPTNFIGSRFESEEADIARSVVAGSGPPAMDRSEASSRPLISFLFVAGQTHSSRRIGSAGPALRLI